ncbi:glutaminyl-peptide cyclotransferase [Sphingomonas astaxanthinifaciens]|uniref:Glutaminyl-peptide cyclotransferase n=1 Tax=Sphingomonas astaxanthinifaciens DSM 22298 TaxID=1123267 RepID=A0ABQ5Z641_9SPHN|nr:glutaminyl-peptide cyclotransferase [Sphingomonas astaxanthinifaciens]GLR47006.1 glutaminyl-peptide cyclotransferase [Sphingomonas astaxanthinifaciens DSM 22298]
MNGSFVIRFFTASLVAFLSAPAPAALPVEPARVLSTHPHDTAAFTEGLLIRDGILYESTGFEGQSFISRKELATGRTLARVAIPSDLFGEGIVDWQDKLYSFVWRGGRGFVWGVTDLKPKGKWNYAGEGWAMTQDGRHIIMSDGTPVLRFLRPGSMKIARRLTVTAEGKPVAMLNELEYVNGEILANIWQTPRIARIDPATGRVKGWIDVSALWDRVGRNSPDAVPNGIAYDRHAKKLYVTGKYWPTLFEIALPGR